MNRLDHYLLEYSASHQNPINIVIHKIFVPIIFFSILGILKALPVPLDWPLWLDWSWFAIGAAFIFYISLKNLRVLLFMTLMVTISVLILEYLRPKFFILSLMLFIVGWIFQFIGHKIEGKRPSFFNDFLFLLIGPLWIVKKIIKP